MSIKEGSEGIKTGYYISMNNTIGFSAMEHHSFSVRNALLQIDMILPLMMLQRRSTQETCSEEIKGDLFVPVYWGSGVDLLKKGGCQMPSSAFIGSDGNTVINAHVNTFFRELDQLAAGDTVMLYTDYGQFTYKVTERITFDAEDTQYLQKTDDERLTLYTCEKNLLAESAKRVGVVCSLEKRAYYIEKTEEGSE